MKLSVHLVILITTALKITPKHVFSKGNSLIPACLDYIIVQYKILAGEYFGEFGETNIIRQHLPS